MMAGCRITAANTPRRRRGSIEPRWTSAEIFVFDVEGTLVDAMMPTLRCWRETLEVFGHAVGLAELHRYAGMDGDEMLLKLLPGLAKNQRHEMIERQGAHFREEYLPHVPPLPGVRSLFEELRRRECRIALATDCAKDELRHYLEVAKIEDLADAIACGDDIRRGKPAPRVLELALRRVRAGRKLSVFIGDTPFDAQAARKTGVIPVGVLTGHFSERELLDAGCATVMRDMVALQGALTRHTAEAA
jgi:phosphoglycolate phosphatase-like HAD superfamily hydrolase